MVFIIILSVCAFGLRAYPRFILKYNYLHDTFVHLYVASEIRKNRFVVPSKIARIMMTHRHDYPFLYHYFLALFPGPVRFWVERFTGALFDTASVVLLFFFAQTMVEYYQLPTLLPYYFAGLYAFSPALLRLGSGPRAYNGSPRVLAQTLYFSHILTFFLFTVTGQWWFAAASVLAGALLFVNSKFGVQALVFFTLFFTIFFSYQYILFLISSFVLSNIITFGRAFQVLEGQYRYSHFYFFHLQQILLFNNKYFHKSFSDYQKILRDHFYILRTRFDLYKIASWFFEESYFLHVLVAVFTPFFILPLYIFYPPTHPIELFMIVWALAGLCMYIFTKIKRFLFLGEAERYAEYALPASPFLAVDLILFKDLPFLLIIFGVYYLISALFYLHKYFQRYEVINAKFNKTAALFEQINEYPTGNLMPIGIEFWQALYRTKHPILTLGINVDTRKLPIEEFMLVYAHYPLPSKDFEKIISDYDIDYIFTKKHELEKYTREIAEDAQIVDKYFEVVGTAEDFIFMKKRAN